MLLLSRDLWGILMESSNQNLDHQLTEHRLYIYMNMGLNGIASVNLLSLISFYIASNAISHGRMFNLGLQFLRKSVSLISANHKKTIFKSGHLLSDQYEMRILGRVLILSDERVVLLTF